ncbi:MAG: hypothetical protein ABJP45_02400 [Cyclobacteriaceae bacterium]
MRKSDLFRIAAICSLLSGLLLIIGWTINIKRDSLLGASLVLAAYILAMFAYMGIYGIQYSKLTLFGFLGFFFLIIACAVFTPFLFLDLGRISNVVVANWKTVQEEGATHVVGVVGALGFLLGYIFLGIDTLRAKVFNKWPAILLIIAAIMPLIYTWVPIGKLLPRIGGLALIGFGINLWVLTRDLEN